METSEGFSQMWETKAILWEADAAAQDLLEFQHKQESRRRDFILFIFITNLALGRGFTIAAERTCFYTKYETPWVQEIMIGF